MSLGALCYVIGRTKLKLYSVQLCWQNAERWLVSCRCCFCFASVRCTYSSFCLIYFNLFNLFNLEMEWLDAKMLQLIELYTKIPCLSYVLLDSRSACNFRATKLREKIAGVTLVLVLTDFDCRNDQVFEHFALFTSWFLTGVLRWGLSDILGANPLARVWRHHCFPSSRWTLSVIFCLAHYQRVHDGLQFLIVLSNLTTTTNVRHCSNVVLIRAAD